MLTGADWFCTQCGTRNAASNEKCLACTAPRPVFLKAEEIPKQPADQPGPPRDPGSVPLSADRRAALERTRGHLKVCGTLIAVMGGLWLVASIFIGTMGTLDFNGMLENSTTRESQLQGLAVGVIGGTGSLLIALASVIGGFGVARLRPWGRTAGFIAGIANILGCLGMCIPSIALGIWLLVLLSNENAGRIFQGAGVSSV